MENNKQETLEEAAEKYADFSNDYVPLAFAFGSKFNETTKRDFIEGAKWQAKRSYSEEEVVKLWNWLNDGFIIRKSLPTREELIGWFEQFKKK